MGKPNTSESTSELESHIADDSAEIATNIERYLNNHTREGGHAYQHNMAARRETWHPLHVSHNQDDLTGIQTEAP
jgi:hypothetical protein